MINSRSDGGAFGKFRTGQKFRAAQWWSAVKKMGVKSIDFR